MNPLPHSKLIVVEPAPDGRPKSKVIVDHRENRSLDEAESLD